MGHKMPIVCKELYIPNVSEDENLTLDEYKNKTGIDLKKYVVLTENGEIYLNFPLFTKVYIVEIDPFSKNYLYGSSPVYPAFALNSVAYESGSTDGILMLGHTSSVGAIGLEFEIDKDEEFNVENIRITKTVI